MRGKRFIFLLAAMLFLRAEANIFAAELQKSVAFFGDGFNSHLAWGDFPVRDRQLDILKNNGAVLVRFSLLWYQVEAVRGKYDFSRLDAILDSAKKANIEVLLIFDGPFPAWIKRPVADHLEDFLALTKATVSHAKGRIRFYEVMNEPNRRTHWNGIPDPERYAVVLQQAYKLIKAIDPNAMVVHGGLARVPIAFLERELKAGMGDAFDLVNVHPYCTQDFPERELPVRMAQLDALLKRYGVDKKPRWATEMGNPTAFQFPHPAFLKAGLAVLKVTPENIDAGYFDDPSWRYFSRTQNFNPAELARFRSIKKLTMAQLSAFRGNLLILPPFRDFPEPYFEALVDFVAKGGILVVSGGGAPASWGLHRDAEGRIVRRKLSRKWEKIRNRLFAGNLKNDSYLSYAPGQEWQKELPAWPLPFHGNCLNAEALREQDAFTPILLAKRKKDATEVPVAGVVRFRSDWRGAVILFAAWLPENDETVTEDLQARLLARNALLVRNGRFELCCVYNLAGR
ncbi:MAG: cellulase family glycosylhydrolase, partial [Victivallaceae bacterium]|nr:cellulase family glycosylhydrolase [Victivallaceae bacterium]